MTMTLYIQVKKLGKRMQAVGSVPYEPEVCPATLEALICHMVSDGVAAYNRRLQENPLPNALSESRIEDLSQVGKIGFGIPFGQKAADRQAAIDTALLAFRDGLYRFFINDREVTRLDAPLHLQDGDTVTIIRLTMLTGGLF